MTTAERLAELKAKAIEDVAIIAATDKPPTIYSKPKAVRK